MFVSQIPVSSAGMARKEPSTNRSEQFNVRLTPSDAARVEAYREKFKEIHGVAITATAIFESALIEWLDKREPLLTKPKAK